MSRSSGEHYHGDLARDLMDAALETIGSEGVDSVSLRALSRTLGVSHGAPAKHFKDRSGLFTAIATEAFEMLDHAMRTASEGVDDPLDALRASGIAYVWFSISHPGHFVLMWQRNIYDTSNPPLAAASAATYQHLDHLVRHAQQSGWMGGSAPDDVVASIWAGVHGIAQLWNSEVFEARYHEHPDDAVATLIDLVVRDRPR